MTRAISPIASALSLALLAAAPAAAQNGPTKIQGKLICGSFSAEPKTSPSWHDELNVVIDRGTITAERTQYPPPQGVVFKGIVAPSGAILIAGAGSLDGKADWNYEFAGKLNKDGTTQLRGRLTATKPLPGYRVCTMSF
jgi:hypothetical protein